MITDIYLETGKDVQTKKSCISPLFEFKWGGIYHRFVRTERKKKQTRTIVEDYSIAAIKSNDLVDDVKACTVKRYNSWAELYEGVGSTGRLSCGASYIPCSETAEQTICVKPADYETDCPITDIRLVWDKDYDAEALKGYKKAQVQGSDDLTWGLYYSKNTASLPVSSFKFTAQKPCSLTNTFLSDPGKESANKWMTRDKYASECTYREFDSQMQKSYRKAGSDFTMNELDLLNKLGAIDKAAALKRKPANFNAAF